MTKYFLTLLLKFSSINKVSWPQIHTCLTGPHTEFIVNLLCSTLRNLEQICIQEMNVVWREKSQCRLVAADKIHSYFSPLYTPAEDRCSSKTVKHALPYLDKGWVFHYQPISFPIVMRKAWSMACHLRSLSPSPFWAWGHPIGKQAGWGNAAVWRVDTAWLTRNSTCCWGLPRSVWTLGTTILLMRKNVPFHLKHSQ